DHDVFLELLAKLGGDAGRMDHRLGIVAVNVENRGFDHERNIRGIWAGAAKMWRGSKTDLVVHHVMDGAAGAMPFEAREAKAFRHDALTGKGRVAVQKQGQYLGAVGVVPLILLGTHLAEDD